MKNIDFRDLFNNSLGMIIPTFSSVVNPSIISVILIAVIYAISYFYKRQITNFNVECAQKFSGKKNIESVSIDRGKVELKFHKEDKYIYDD